MTSDLLALVMARWQHAALATWNKHLAALRSFTAHARRQRWLEPDPAQLLERRKTSRRDDRASPAARLDKLFRDDRNGLRERTLRRMLYDTAAHASEVLTLDIEDLDLEFRRARTTSKGGTVEYLYWATATARLLLRLLAGRTSGPLFLADRRSPSGGRRARAMADIDPATSRGRLSYPRACLPGRPGWLSLPHGAAVGDEPGDGAGGGGVVLAAANPALLGSPLLGFGDGVFDTDPL
ncbi:hypothetical protein ACFLIM_48395 [Nonomuraea sp. M3C6]|uniref:Phage integrase family protein n=1 Tax=Nonomuraea marmarensis TaxID=3351344 RepID=A0ABW7AUA4_9ACTN